MDLSTVNLIFRYNGNANAALKMLNKARKDPVLGQKALLLMIDIYVNPTGGVLGGDAMENGNIGDGMANGAAGDKENMKDVALNTAETLIRVIYAVDVNLKFRTNMNSH